MRARFVVHWEDFDYESWAAECGCSSARVEPRADKLFDLHVEGSAEAIAAFGRDLSHGPEETAEAA